MHRRAGRIGTGFRSPSGRQSMRSVWRQINAMRAAAAQSTNETHKQIEKVRQCPADFLVHSGDSVNHNFSAEDEHRVNEPGA